MQKEEFITNFANQFDETEASEITFNTVFKDLDEWSSLTTLSIIAMCDEVYGVKITGDDLKKSKTVEDLYKLILNRK